MKSVFYTCVTGPDSGYVHDVSSLSSIDFDFVALHDSHRQVFPGWTSVNLDDFYPHKLDQYGHKQRYAKTMPQLFFADYDYSAYLDPKWEITQPFLDFCAESIRTKRSWMVPHHPQRTTLVQEFLFPFCNGILSLDECTRVIDLLLQKKVDFSQYFSSLCTWMIRQHNQTNKEIGERWFDLILQSYEHNVRDQILLPFATKDPSAIDRSLSINQLYDCGVKLNYPNQTRIKRIDWEIQINDLLIYIGDKTGLPTKLYVKPARNDADLGHNSKGEG